MAVAGEKLWRQRSPRTQVLETKAVARDSINRTRSTAISNKTREPSHLQVGRALRIDEADARAVVELKF